jgi:hypothetical protein
MDFFTSGGRGRGRGRGSQASRSRQTEKHNVYAVFGKDEEGDNEIWLFVKSSRGNVQYLKPAAQPGLWEILRDSEPPSAGIVRKTWARVVFNITGTGNERCLRTVEAFDTMEWAELQLACGADLPSDSEPSSVESGTDFESGRAARVAEGAAHAAAPRTAAGKKKANGSKSKRKVRGLNALTAESSDEWDQEWRLPSEPTIEDDIESSSSDEGSAWRSSHRQKPPAPENLKAVVEHKQSGSAPRRSARVQKANA